MHREKTAAMWLKYCTKPGRQPSAGSVCGKVNVYTSACHVKHMCSLRKARSSASQKVCVCGGGGGEHSLEGGQIFPQKSLTHWLAANSELVVLNLK